MSYPDDRPEGLNEQLRREANRNVFNGSLLAPSMAMNRDMLNAALLLRAQQGLLNYPSGVAMAINPLYTAQLAAAQCQAALNPFARVMAFPQPGPALFGLPALSRPVHISPAMGVEVTPPPPTPSWTEGRTEDGRVFYHNKATGESIWRKPDELKTPDEKSGSSSGDRWDEYTAKDGRKYYHNPVTNQTRWTIPEAPLDSSTNEEVKEETGQSEMDRAMAATLASLPKDTAVNVASLSDVPFVDPEVEKRKRWAERFTDLLRDKYVDGKISASCNWDKAVPFIQADPRFRIISKVSEKKQLFNAWKIQKQKEEREEKRLGVKKAKEDLELWLLSHPKMKNSRLQYRRADEMFEDHSIWRAVDDDDRREIFRDTHQRVTEKEEAEKAETAKRNEQMLHSILGDMREISHRTTWAQAQRLLIENPLFAADETLQSMDKMDALIVFEKHIRNLEKLYDEEKLNEEKRGRRQERKTREAFQSLLKELHERGEVTSVSLWSTLYTTISSDARFDSILYQSGSTPLDLFKFYVEDLKEQYGNDRKIIKEIIAAQGRTIVVTTTLDELVSWVHQDEKGKKVDMGNLKLCYNSFVEKAESKEKEIEREEARKERRLESEFRNLLRTIQPPIEPDTKWSAVRTKIEKELSFKAIGSEEEREMIFNEFAHDTIPNSTSEKKKKDKRDSESDGDIRNKKIKRNHHPVSSDDDQSHRRKKKSKKRRSQSPPI